jgi:teichoic acid transport system permease protein
MLHGWHRIELYINPLGPVLSANADVWILGKHPSMMFLAGSVFWAVFSILFGGYFFVSRERDFAVRI